MKITALVEAMVIAGATPEMILVAVRATEQQLNDALEKRRENDKDRQARKREKDLASRDVTLRHSDSILTGGGVTRVEDKPLPQKKTEQEESKKDAPAGDVLAFRAALSPFLDTERLDALAKHRRSKRAQLTGHAAKLFLRDAEACGLSVADAVDTCISRNWVTVKPEYNIGQPRGSPVPKPKPEKLANGFGRVLNEMRQQREIRSGESGPSLPAPVPNLSLVSGR